MVVHQAVASGALTAKPELIEGTHSVDPVPAGDNAVSYVPRYSAAFRHYLGGQEHAGRTETLALW